MRMNYSVSNLRRLVNTPFIEIRPITLLLGRNSAGKSTFLRSFPLLRQSVETKASAPVLWYGDYVDFGQFRGAVNNNDEEKSITFSFNIQDFFGDASSDFWSLTQPGLNPNHKRISLDIVEISYSLRSESKSTVRSNINIKIPSIGSKLDLIFSDTGTFVKEIVLDGKDMKTILQDVDVYFPTSSIFSNCSFLRLSKDNKYTPESRHSLFISAIHRALKPYLDGRIGLSTITHESSRILQKSKLDDEAFASLITAQTKTFRRIYSYMRRGVYGPLRAQLDAICRLNFFFKTVDALSSQLSAYFRSVEYIGPARARSERFYRQQELEVSEISPDGRNLPMFLASLTELRLNRFSSWVERMFGYGVAVKRIEGHISINLEQSGKSINVVDTGYGVSQVLPVLAQIWWMQQGQRDRRFAFTGAGDRKVLAIEQPELHLHPAHQALLADVFVEAASSKGSNSAVQLSLLIETHSESIVNRVGELISKGRLSADEVQIVIFGNDESGLGEDVRLSTYDSDGTLMNWPYGFFNY